MHEMGPMFGPRETIVLWTSRTSTVGQRLSIGFLEWNRQLIRYDHFTIDGSQTRNSPVPTFPRRHRCRLFLPIVFQIFVSKESTRTPASIVYIVFSFPYYEKRPRTHSANEPGTDDSLNSVDFLPSLVFSSQMFPCPYQQD